MSHVATIDIEIKDLDCLRAAAADLGMEFREGQRTYRWWGRSVGDYPLPEGFAAADLGTCEHALAVAGNPDAYEVGVARRRDGQPGYALLWDFYAGGRGLQAAVGKGAGRLKQAYAARVTEKQMRRKGLRVARSVDEQGRVHLRTY